MIIDLFVRYCSTGQRIQNHHSLLLLHAVREPVNRTGDITRAVSEPDYRKQLYAEYGL